MFSFIKPHMDVHSFRGPASTANTRSMVPLSYDEMAIGQRIHDAFIRRHEINGDAIPGNKAQVFYKGGILTLDCETSEQHHSRVVLGPDDRATFMEYDLHDDGSRKMTVSTHLAADDEEKKLESELTELKHFALEAQHQTSFQKP